MYISYEIDSFLMMIFCCFHKAPNWTSPLGPNRSCYQANGLHLRTSGNIPVRQGERYFLQNTRTSAIWRPSSLQPCVSPAPLLCSMQWAYSRSERPGVPGNFKSPRPCSYCRLPCWEYPSSPSTPACEIFLHLSRLSSHEASKHPLWSLFLKLK